MIFWVCPDPLDEKRCVEAEAQYNRGLYISKERRWITRTEYDDFSR
jgi:hypothetical protein